jgi:hypothetical protein
MKPAVTGVLVAAAVIVAFIAGREIQVEEQTPAEAFGEAVEDIADSAEDAAEEATE